MIFQREDDDSMSVINFIIFVVIDAFALDFERVIAIDRITCSDSFF